MLFLWMQAEKLEIGWGKILFNLKDKSLYNKIIIAKKNYMMRLQFMSSGYILKNNYIQAEHFYN